MFLTLGDRFGVDDRGSKGQISGWGIPGWAQRRAQMGLAGTMKPLKVGARYVDCGDCYTGFHDGLHGSMPQYSKFTGSQPEYQEAVTAHFTANHPDLHYPIDQNGLDLMEKMKRKAKAAIVREAELEELATFMIQHPELFKVEGATMDVSGSYRPVTRPRELADFTELDFPDANVADGGTEEIELDQLISIAARQGRRLLGVEIQNLDAEFTTEYLTAPSGGDLEISIVLALNTRTGAQNLDDPENLWRSAFHTAIQVAAATEVSSTNYKAENDVPPGGVVYVSPRLFLRMENAMDRQIDTGDLFTRIATVTQPLSTFLLFELLEQFSGLFGFAA